MGSEYNHMLLGRLQADCEYFLGYGYRNSNLLWARDVVEQIAMMRKLHNGFPKGEKPVWQTLEQIDNYERLMLG